MKLLSLRSLSAFCFSICLGLVANAAPAPGGMPGTVGLNPAEKVVQGNQPLSESYVLTITSPSNLTSAVTVVLDVSVLSKPTAVSDAIALGFISLSSPTLTFTGPNQQRTVTVSVIVPLGDFAGDYAYEILPMGWPDALNLTNRDAGATVNARVSPSQSTDTTPPAVTLLSPANGSVYTYYPATNTAASVPVVFEATVGTNGQPISALKAYLDGVPVTVTSTGLGTLSASAQATLSLTAANDHTIRVEATNQNGTSEASADFSVIISAPPPTITVASPAVNATFTLPNGGGPVSVPVSFTANSAYGNITAAGALLDGNPVALSLSGVGTALTATGTATLSLSTPGNYTLVFSAANDYGPATPVSVPFTVKAYVPTPVPPTVTILTPANGSVFTRVQGSAPTVVNYTFKAGTLAGTIQSVTVSLNGTPVTATVNGLNTAVVTGSGQSSFSAAGTHTLSVTATSAGGTASATTTFTIKQTPAQVCRDLTWLPPISLNKTVEGGSTVPVKFTLSCKGCFVRDQTILIAIYEIYSNGSTSTPVIYPYGAGSNPNPPDYAINGNHYQLNFPTASGVHRYRIEVYYPLTSNGSSLQLLGSKEFLTKGANSGKSDKSCKSDKSGKSYKSDKSHKSDKSGKSYKSNKSDKSSKSGKSDKSDKSGKSYKSDKSGKSYKSDKSDKSNKSGKGSKW